MSEIKRVTFLKNKEPYGSLELAKQALNSYAEANSLLDGEPIIGRYTDGGQIKLVLGICTVLAVSESGCVTSEKLTFFVDEESIDSLRLENLTDVDVLSKLEGDILFYDGEKWINKPYAVFDENYVHTDENYTGEEKNKLSGIENGAEVNVQSDWEENDEDSDSFIRNKPDVVLQTEFLEHTGNSGIHVTTNDKTNWNQKLDPVNQVNDDITKNYVSSVTQSTDGQISVTKGTLANVATSGSYDDLLDTPTIPTVNDATLTIQKNGGNLGTFTANSNTNTVIDIPVPTNTSDIVNDSGFITQNDVLSYKAFPSSWPKNDTIIGLINAITNDENATTGMSYMSTVYYNDLPGNLSQGEIQVDIMEVIEGLGKNIKLTLCSSDTSPYHWEYISPYSQSGAWRSFVVNGSLSQVAYSGNYNDLSNKPTIPTALSQLSDDTTHRVVTDTEKTTWDGKSVVTVSNTGSSTTPAKYLTVNGTEYKLASDAPIENIAVGGNNVTITNRVAEIPSADSTHEGTLAASDYVSFSGKYTKPANGIPESDLDSAVQTSLGKADTALQPSAISDMQTKSNKVNAWQNTPDNDHYPSEKLVKDSLDNKQNTLSTQTAYTSQGTSTKVPQITTNTLGQVTGITEVSIDFPTIPSGSGSVTGSATSFVKDVTLSGHTLSGHTQAADSSIDENSASLPTSQAVRSFVNSSISNMAAYYMTKNAAGDPFDSETELMAATTFYSGGVAKVPTLNDYTIVVHDETQAIEVPGYSSFTTKHDYIGYYVLISSVYTLVTDSNYNTLVFTPGTDKAYELPSTRYINTSTTSTPSWSYQYIINNTGLTAAQIAAVNSGINATKVSAYDTHIADTTIHVTSTDKTNWNTKLDPVNAVADDTSKNYVSAVTQSTSGQISVSKGTLATVATSGSYNDLTNKPTIPAAQVNSDWNASSGLAEILNKPALATVATSGSYNDLTNKPSIPSAPGTLDTDISTAQTVSSSETLSGNIKLHKVSKTGSYNDLLNTPTIPSAPGTLDTTQTTSQATNASEALSGNVKLHKVSKTGTYSDLIGTPSLATVATSGSYNDLTNQPTIPAAQVNSDWNANSGVAEILNKPTIPNIPSQTGQSGKFLTTNGTDMSWATVSSGGGTWGSITGTLSDQTDLQNALDAKQDEIVQQTSAPSNPSDGDLWIDTDETPGGTINLSDLGDITITTPTNGQVLSYNSTTSKWENTAAPSGLPSQTGHSGEFLTTNGTSASWTSIPSIPTPQIADENKLLSVNSSGQYVLVTIVNSENVAY